MSQMECVSCFMPSSASQWGDHTPLVPLALFVGKIEILMEPHFRVREGPKNTKAYADTLQHSQQPFRIDTETH